MSFRTQFKNLSRSDPAFLQTQIVKYRDHQFWYKPKFSVDLQCYNFSPSKIMKDQVFV